MEKVNTRPYKVVVSVGCTRSRGWIRAYEEGRHALARGVWNTTDIND